MAELVEDVSLGRAQARKLLAEATRANRIQSNTENPIKTNKSPNQAPSNETKPIDGPKSTACNHTATKHPELPGVVRFIHVVQESSRYTIIISTWS